MDKEEEKKMERELNIVCDIIDILEKYQATAEEFERITKFICSGAVDSSNTVV